MIQRITKAKAEGLIKVTDDYSDSPVKYYTITPSTSEINTAEDGWEDVTYYTARSNRLTYTPDTSKQYVYILTNPTIPGMVKIGYTKNAPSKRVKQINASTGVAQDFQVAWAFGCYNGIELEQEVHRYCESFRVNNKREFFRMTVDEAKAVIERLGERYTGKDDK